MEDGDATKNTRKVKGDGQTFNGFNGRAEILDQCLKCHGEYDLQPMKDEENCRLAHGWKIIEKGR